MNEAETRAEHIDPALAAAGWGVIEGSHTRREWEQLLASSPNCAECGRAGNAILPCPDSRYRHTWTKGHKIPVLHGGTDDITHLQAECYQCNFRKNAGALKRPECVHLLQTFVLTK